MAGRIKHSTRGAVSYKQEWDPIKAPEPVDFTPQEAEAIRQAGRVRGRLKPKGSCYDCDRPVSGERRFCGPCLAKH